MIDTGCSRAIIAGRIFEKILEDNRPELLFYYGTLLSADDSPIRVFDKHVRHMLLVADIANEGLIGQISSELMESS